MKKNWLWDVKIEEEQVKRILRNSEHEKFNFYAELLLSRVDDPKIVFEFIDEVSFCRKWPNIKKRLRKNKLSNDIVYFWQTIYERIKEQIKKDGIKIKKIKQMPPAERVAISEGIRKIRKLKGLTQKEVAQKLGVIQQYISSIESGKDNFSIDTLINIAKALDKRITIEFED